MYGVAGKYASALYITAVRKNALEPVEAELQQVCGAAETNPVFADFLKDPSVSKAVRVKAIVEIFKNTKFNDVTKNFLGMGLYPYHTNHFFLLIASASMLGCVHTLEMSLLEANICSIVC
jgi:F0F1-type ATP synthase delta subunit